MTKNLSNADLPDSIHIENVICDEQKREKERERDLPLRQNYAASKRLHATKFFFILTLRYSTIFVVVLFSIGFLTFNSKTDYHSGVLALLLACIGYIIPGPKA